MQYCSCTSISGYSFYPLVFTSEYIAGGFEADWHTSVVPNCFLEQDIFGTLRYYGTRI